MKTFLAVYIGTPAAMSKWNELPDAMRAERQDASVRAWHEWVELNNARIIDNGAPLGKTKSISQSGIEDIRNNMTAYTVVRADSHEEAARLFEGHPHFNDFFRRVSRGYGVPAHTRVTGEAFRSSNSTCSSAVQR